MIKIIPWNKGKKFVKRVKCAECGKEIYRMPHDIKKCKNVFCSYGCCGKFNRRKNKKCLICGKEFYPLNPRQKYCSRGCYGKAVTGEKSVNYCRIEKKCAFCGKKIRVIKYFSKRLKFCSRDCADKYHSKRMTANGNPAWKNGIGKLPYGYEFTKQLKNEIKARDNNKCVLCGGLKRLSIHHIDYDKKNNDHKNLITLCEVCHAKTNYNRNKWIKELSNKLKK
jgi:hypothetical protein